MMSRRRVGGCRFSKDTVRALTALLRDHDPARSIRALQRVVERYAEHEEVERTKADLTRRARVWSDGLHKRLSDLVTYLRSLDHRNEATMFTGGPLDPRERQRLIDALQPVIEATATEVRHHVTAPGSPPLPRFLLNLEIAQVLHAAGVPLHKSRRSVAHQIFVEVYATLGLTRGGGDVFQALNQGMALVKPVVWIRRKRVR